MKIMFPKFVFPTMRCMIICTALALGVSFAADIDGKWTAQFEGRNGEQTQTLTLKASDNGLTGTIQGARGPAAEISNGAIDGNNISFTVVREFRNNKMTQEYKGTVSGGVLKLTVSGRRGGSREVTYKKE
ncbi:MAG TPA: hypothetical protein VK724_08150 [Bryobacteraceae bacterium]|jgi:hypothetical protein|nr:hypothetical protein [Bryobacteraceae bacterium]